MERNYYIESLKQNQNFKEDHDFNGNYAPNYHPQYLRESLNQLNHNSDNKNPQIELSLNDSGSYNESDE